jgi:hypothetical protein
VEYDKEYPPENRCNPKREEIKPRYEEIKAHNCKKDRFSVLTPLRDRN